MRLRAAFGSLLATAALGAVEAPPTVHLAADEPVPDELAGAWQRAADAAVVTVSAGEPAGEIAAGLYRLQREGEARPRRIFLRSGSGAGARAASLVGQRTLVASEYSERIAHAEALLAFDHLTLVVATWRLADDFDWPWVEPAARLRGLPQLCQRVNPTTAGFVYDQGQAAYVADDGRAVRFAASGPEPRLALGDLVTSVGPADEFATIGILVEDRGRVGWLDPEDVVVTAQVAEAGGALAPQVHRQLLGHLHGPQPVHCFRRDRARAEAYRVRRDGGPPIGKDNPIWDLPRWRQMLALIGLVIVILVLLRNIRRYRRSQSRR